MLLHVSHVVGLDSERLVADVTLVPLLLLKLVGGHVRPQAREVQKSLQMITAGWLLALVLSWITKVLTKLTQKVVNFGLNFNSHKSTLIHPKNSAYTNIEKLE